MPDKLKQDISIGHNLQKLRQKSGLSQEQVSAQLQLRGHSVTREMISQMERGKYNIRISILLELADIYHVEIQEFFQDIS